MEKIKQYITSDKGRDILVIIIIILVGLGSFGLGRLSKESPSTGIKVEYPNSINQEANVLQSASPNALTANSNISSNSKKTNSGNFFASSRGSKYYSVGCSAGKTIKQENRVYFMTKEEAERAGYELSSACR